MLNQGERKLEGEWKKKSVSKPPSPSRPPVCAFILGHLAANDDLESNQGKWLLKAHRLTGGRKMTFAKSEISKYP